MAASRRAALAKALSLPALDRDSALIILARGLRSFGIGAVSVVFAIYLERAGLGLVSTGVVLTCGLAGATASTFLVGVAGDAYGRRRTMVAFSLLMGAGGAAIAVVHNLPGLCALAFVGSFSLVTLSPLQPLEHAALAGASPHGRTDRFALYGLVATAGSALGSLAGGLPSLLEHAYNVDRLTSMQAMLALYGALAASGAALYVFLTRRVDAPATHQGWVNPMRLRSRRQVFKLAGLFGVDSFAGSMLVQSLVSYWFYTKFGFALSSLGFLFFVSQVLAALSYWIAARLARRIGLVNTMVWTHIPASFFLIAMPFVPAAWAAVLLWQLRSFLAQMDVPTRESYTMGVAPEEERVPVSSMLAVTRSVAGTASPSFGTWLWHAASAGGPFVFAGALKIAYDLALFALFRHVRPPEEQRAG